MLVEKTRTTAVTGTAESGDYNYKVNYSVDGKILLKINCNVYKKATETSPEEYAGMMLQENGNKQTSFRQSVEVAPHLQVFETILSEVNASLVPDAVE